MASGAKLVNFASSSTGVAVCSGVNASSLCLPALRALLSRKILAHTNIISKMITRGVIRKCYSHSSTLESNNHERRQRRREILPLLRSLVAQDRRRAQRFLRQARQGKG